MMPIRQALPLAMAASLAAVASPAVASDSKAFSVKIANDGMISNDDGHYTSGVALGYSFAPDADHWSQRVSRALPDGLIERAERAEYRLTHKIYTPDNIKTSALIEDDRPYAGLVYGGVSLFGTDATARGRVTTDLHLDLGMVGPSSLADSIQQEVHRRLGNNRPQGWSHQLGDEAIVNLGVQRQWWQETPLAGKQLAYGPAAGVALGNLHTYASIGYNVRFGDEARSVPSLSPRSSSSAGFDAEKGWRWYLFAGTEGYYVAHNLLLDGNTFSSSHSVSRREWVGDLSAGLALGWNDWQVRFAAVQRSREFRGQDDPDKFAALTLGKRL
ncbi:lipid A deacylase LpxR family protein [Halomonas piscis]|uniref:lipid A deacylase LpxR family protein n=1 Tax=Halomonas piscis TaxID=3031727 RepID=UPI00289701C2|nr:lipid A deacylase LpxR family protein [Halomonas piscis]